MENKYLEELKKFIGKEVEIIDNKDVAFTGTLIAINFSHLSVILRTKFKTQVIKLVDRIERKIDPE